MPGTADPPPLPFAIFVSGVGTTLEGLAERIRDGGLPARIAVVVADRAECPAIDKARRLGLDTIVRPIRTMATPAAWADAIALELDRRGVRLIVLAGFLSVVPPELVARYPGRIINLHPSLLPRFGGRGMYGRRVHEAVLRSGDRETGVTVHVVTDSVDAGPVLHQLRLALRPDDTPERLRERLHPLEVEALAETIARFARGELPEPSGVRGSA